MSNGYFAPLKYSWQDEVLKLFWQAKAGMCCALGVSVGVRRYWHASAEHG